MSHPSCLPACLTRVPSAAEEALKRAAGDALRLAHAMLPLHPLRLVALDQLGNALGETIL